MFTWRENADCEMIFIHWINFFGWFQLFENFILFYSLLLNKCMKGLNNNRLYWWQRIKFVFITTFKTCLYFHIFRCLTYVGFFTAHDCPNKKISKYNNVQSNLSHQLWQLKLINRIRIFKILVVLHSMTVFWRGQREIAIKN